MEEKGTGVNRFTYFVTENAFSSWKKLPNLAPKHIEGARSVKILLSGDLEKKIICNPYFFGKEKHYLRAQIARISLSTSVVPAGSKKLVEDNDREIIDNEPEDGELVLPNTSEMGKADQWVHESASILLCNRTSHIDPPDEAPENFDGEEYDVEAERKKIIDADPFEPRLKPISKDCCMRMAQRNITQPSWVVRMMGDPSEYKDESAGGKAGAPTLCYGCVVLRSLVWPGSFTFYQNQRQVSVYVGDGLKFDHQVKPFPLQPPSLIADEEEYEEFVLPPPKDMAAIEVMIEKTVEKMWEEYDTDGNGYLDKEEAMKLIKNTMVEMSSEVKNAEDDTIEEAFNQFDADGNGRIAKNEMANFIRKLVE